MTKQNKLILAVVIVLLGIGIAVWQAKRSPLAPERSVNTASKPPVMAPTAPQSQPAAAPSAAISRQRQYASIPFMERHAILVDIKKKDLASIYRIWLEAGRVERDLLKQGDVASLLATALGERKANPELLEQMRKFIADSANSNHDRAQLISVLGDAQTKEVIDLLLGLATALMEKGPKQAVLDAIGQLGTGGGNHEDLSPALERVWRESDDQTLLVYVAKALAQVGASSGINLLLDSALTQQDNNQRRAAWGALVSAMILNPNAVPPLAECLATQPPGSAGSKLARDTIARMTTPAAANALLNWLQNADGSAAPLAHDYVIRATSPAQLAAWESALNPAVPFRSEKNREAVRAGLAKFHRDHGY